MKRISIVGLCLTAVFAFSAGIASSASAGELLARVPGGGSVVGVTFLSKAELPLLITHNNSRMHCKDAINFGHFLTSSLGDILIQFLGCTLVLTGGSCNSLGAAAGEIHLPLATTLFHLGLAHLTSTVGKIPAVLILLNKDVHIECGGAIPALILVLGAVIGALRLDKEGNHGPLPLNTPFLQALLAYEQTANGLQHLRLFLLGGSLASYDLDFSINGGAAELASEIANVLLFHFLLPSGVENDIELVEDQ
jgi:hypothetical protein